VSRILLIAALFGASLGAQTFPTSTTLPAALPDGAGVCVPGATLALPVPVTGVSGATAVTLDFTFAPAHTWHGDIECVVTNPAGSSAMVMIPGCFGSLDDSSDVAGPYVLSDAAAMTFDAAALAAGVVIPAGTYGPDVPLNGLLVGCGDVVNGVWTVTWRDHFIGDAGAVSACALTFTTGAPSNAFVVCQTGAGAPVNLIHQAGAVPITYTNAANFSTPAAVPFGWWFGLDVPLSLLLDELTNPVWGPIFIGSLGAGATNVVVIPLPAGFNFQIVGVHFNAAGNPIFASVPLDYTVL
jgi:hypothetical protein